jgi:serine/threonine protein kinase
MATRQLPFRGESLGVIFDGILNRAPLSPLRLNPDLPPKLEDIINKCLEKDRNPRYQQASDIRIDVQRISSPIAVLAHPPCKIESYAKPCYRSSSVKCVAYVSWA